MNCEHCDCPLIKNDGGGAWETNEQEHTTERCRDSLKAQRDSCRYEASYWRDMRDGESAKVARARADRAEALLALALNGLRWDEMRVVGPKGYQAKDLIAAIEIARK